MNAREEIHGLSRANVDMLERSAARALLGCGISLLAGAVWLLTGPVAKADVVTDWNVTAGDKSLPCINIARLSPFMALFGRDRRVGEYLLLREERKLGLRGAISVLDPKRH
jgi:hypothetical protein